MSYFVLRNSPRSLMIANCIIIQQTGDMLKILSSMALMWGKCRSKQDFGKTPSYYLNDEFRWATKLARYRFPDSWAIILYDIPSMLLEQQHNHLDLSQEHSMWKNIVRRSRNGLYNEADDDYDSVFGTQSENGGELINDRYAKPKQSADKNQLALKTRKLTKKVDLLLKGVIIYRNDFVMV